MITGIILYFMQSAICMAFFYALYWLFLKKDTFFRVNRVFLLLTLVASLIIPSLEIPIQAEPEGSIENAYHMLDAVVKASQHYLNSNMLEEVVVTASVDKSLSWYQYLGIIYILGVFVFSIRFLRNVGQLLSWVRYSRRYNQDGIQLVVMDDDFPPFSFLNFVFVGKEDYQKDNFTSIFAHERVHIDQLHTFDLLMIEVLTVLFWLNPFIWWYKSSIQEVHEYLADDQVANDTDCVHQYKMHIVNQFAGGDLFRLANNFGQSTLKKRISMLGRIKTPKVALIKLILLIPIFFLLLSAFAFTIKEEEKFVTEFSIAELIPTNVDLFSFRNEKNEKTLPQIKKSASIVNGIKNLEHKRTFNPEELREVIDEPLNSPSRLSARIKNASDYHLEDILRIKGELTPAFIKVEKMPQFVACNGSLRKYIARNVHYPVLAAEQGYEGRVYVQFIVGKDGRVSKSKIIQGRNVELNREAIRVVNSMPTWIPGEQGGEKVQVSYTIPIRFSLN